MTDFEKARKNMVDCQLLPNGIRDEALIEAFLSVPREKYVPDDFKNVAYVDEDIIFDNGVVFPDPLVCARLIQLLHLGKDDVVCVKGDRTGYISAVLSSLVSTVVVKSLCDDASYLSVLSDKWKADGYFNIAPVEAKEGEKKDQAHRYDAILIAGSVANVSPDLTDDLSAEGRLSAVLRPNASGIGRISLIERTQTGAFSVSGFYDAATPYISGYEPEKGFVF